MVFRDFLIGYNMPTEEYSFSLEQIKLIEDNHYYIFVFLNYMKLEINNYYDVVLFGFLCGIGKYGSIDKMENPKLSLKRLLWLEMKYALYRHDKIYMNANSRRVNTGNNWTSLECENKDGDTYYPYDKDAYNLEKHVETRQIINKCLNGEIFGSIETAFARLIVYGYSERRAVRKIASITKMEVKEIDNRILTMRIMLKSYVRYGV